jgi:DNA-binding transcriptional LysR family regulator
MSQPAVSSQLKSLEEELGFLLFTRTPKGMLLTEEGKAVLKESEEIIKLFDNMLENAKHLNTSSARTVNIGQNTDSEMLRIQELITNEECLKNKVNFSMIQTRSEDFLTDITSERIDAGFFYGEVNSKLIEYFPLSSFRLTIVSPVAWEKEIKKMPLKEIAELPWIWTTSGCPFSQAAEEFFNSKQIKPKKIMYVDDEMLVGRLVNSETGCSILAEPIAEKLQQESTLSIIDCLDTDINLNFGYLKKKKNTKEIKITTDAVIKIWQT